MLSWLCHELTGGVVRGGSNVFEVKNARSVEDPLRDPIWMMNPGWSQICRWTLQQKRVTIALEFIGDRGAFPECCSARSLADWQNRILTESALQASRQCRSTCGSILLTTREESRHEEFTALWKQQLQTSRVWGLKDDLCWCWMHPDAKTGQEFS